MSMRNKVLRGNALLALQDLTDSSVHCCVTSPPYWNLRDYGHRDWFGGDPVCEHDKLIVHGPHHPGQVEQTKWRSADGAGNGQTAVTNTCSKCGAWYGQIGLEPSPEAYVEHIVSIFREVRRVLHPKGTLWLVIGDSYFRETGATSDLKSKDLVGIPWRVALALQKDGWWLRSDIIWAKGFSGDYLGGTCMPESVKDRPTKAHEYVFLFSKSQNYFYDSEAVAEVSVTDTLEVRNRRSVWHVKPKPYKGAHFAVMPPDLVSPCVLAGTSERGVCPHCGEPWLRTDSDNWMPSCKCPNNEPLPAIVLDPFAGSGTALMVAKMLRRDFLGIERNPNYHDMIHERVQPAMEVETGRQIHDLVMSLGDEAD